MTCLSHYDLFVAFRLHNLHIQAVEFYTTGKLPVIAGSEKRDGRFGQISRFSSLYCMEDCSKMNREQADKLIHTYGNW